MEVERRVAMTMTKSAVVIKRGSDFGSIRFRYLRFLRFWIDSMQAGLHVRGNQMILAGDE